MTEPLDEQHARRQDCTCVYLNVEGLGWRPLAWILGHETVHVRFTDGSEETFASQGEVGGVEVLPEGIDTITVIDDNLFVLPAEGDLQILKREAMTSPRHGVEHSYWATWHHQMLVTVEFLKHECQDEIIFWPLTADTP
jgi:hypothetical protein